MDDISPLDSSLPWLWMLEYLSGFKEVDISILRDLINKIPDLPEELTKNTRERVALRSLEELLDPAAGLASDVTTSRVCLDFSQRCEDVLQKILEESPISELKSTREKLLKWDLHPFIVHKRATLPKTALEELKDSIRSSSHPFAAALREISGLRLNKQTNGVPVGDGNHNAHALRLSEGSSDAHTVPEERCTVSSMLKKSNRMSQHSLCNRNGLPSRMRGCKLATENSLGLDDGNRDSSSDIDNIHLNAKRLKLSAGQVSNPPLLKDASVEVVGANEDNSRAYPNESLVGELRQDDHIETAGTADKNCEDVAGDGSVQVVTVTETPNGAVGILSGKSVMETQQNDHIEIASAADKNCEDVAGDGPVQVVTATETPNGAVRSLSGNSMMETQQNVSVGEASDKGDQIPELRTTDSVVADELQRNTNSNSHEVSVDTTHPSEDTIHNDGKLEEERDNISIKKSQFLSSQFTSSQDLCMKCNQEGRVLACSTSGCAIVIHESCLRCPPGFDEQGNFRCPYCVYLISNSKYLEGKKKLALARKELSTFFFSSKDSAQRHGEEQRHSRSGPSTSTAFPDVNASFMNNVANDQRVPEKEILREKEQEKSGPSMSNSFPDVNVSCTDKVANDQRILDEILREMEQETSRQRSPADKQQFEPSSPRGDRDETSELRTQENDLAREKEQAPNFQNKEDMNSTLQRKQTNNQQSMSSSPSGKNVNTSGIEGEPNVLLNEAAPVPTLEKNGKEKAVDGNNGSSSSYPEPAAHVNEQQEAEGVNIQKVFKKRASYQKHSNSPGPQKRRKIISWTPEEENKLREGVRQFPPVDGVMRWKEIRDFGMSVFLPSRTQGDLKDKWRNLNKKTSEARLRSS